MNRPFKDSAFWKTYDDLPPMARGVIVVGGFAVVVLLGYTIYKKWKLVQQENEAQKEANDAAAAVDQWSNVGVKTTKEQAQFDGWAADLAQAFSGCGTDSQAVYDTFSNLNNIADVYKLIATYGTRSYDGCWLFGEFGQKNLSLSAAISDELDSSEKAHLNAILATKNINYSFS